MPTRRKKPAVKKLPPVRLPWPRMADDGLTPLGVDLELKRRDIIKIVNRFTQAKGKPPNIPMEDLLQEIFLSIAVKNLSKSAHDPRKSSFGHYVWMIASNTCCNIVMRQAASTRIPFSLIETVEGLDI